MLQYYAGLLVPVDVRCLLFIMYYYYYRDVY